MNNFKEFQSAKIVFIISIPVQIFLTIMFMTQAGSKPMTLIPFAVTNGTFILSYLLFYGMYTTVDADSIRISYGIGLIRKNINIGEVSTVSIVSNPWYYGWGIRFIPNGMLYNISGSSGIELTFKERSRVIRIGSADPQALANAISSIIKRKSQTRL